MVFHARTIQLRSPAANTARTEGLQTYVLQSVERSAIKTERLVVREVVEVALNRQSKIMMANLTIFTVLVHNLTKIDELAEWPALMANTIDSFPTNIPDDSINANPIYQREIDGDE